MSLGSQLVDELGRRGELGMYFRYPDYVRLRRVDDVPALRQFFLDRGYAAAESTVKVTEFAAVLGRYSQKQMAAVSLLSFPVHAFPYSFLVVPFWLLSMLLCAVLSTRPKNAASETVHSRTKDQ